MNEIYGVDPEAPRSLQDLRSLLERFGPSNGRFIGKYPDDWLSMLESRFSDLSGLDRARLTVLMQRHRDTLLSIEAQYFRSKTWIENAKNLRSFKKVLAAQPNSEDLPTLEDFLWDVAESDSSRGAFIPMTVEAYCDACAPLLSISSEIHITDRFFHLRSDSGNLDRQRFNLLRSIVRKAESAKRLQNIIIHFELPKFIAEERYECQLVEDLNLIQADSIINISYDIHRRLRHGRYIFSIKGGLQFDHGFLLDKSGSNHVHWLSAGELRPIHKTFGIST